MRISDWSSDVCSSDLPGGHKGESRDGEAATGFRRPVEHQLRLLRPPDRLRAPERQYEPHLPVARRGYRATAGPVGRGAADRAARPADHRTYERPHLTRSPRPPPPLFPSPRHPRPNRPVLHALKSPASYRVPGLGGG